jgi:type II secretory pathway predicted ATPase ExeA
MFSRLKVNECRSQATKLLNRIAIRHHLAPLAKSETATYIDFQIKRAGGSEKLFEPAAKE